MVQMQTVMEVADNSGAKRVMVMTVLGQNPKASFCIRSMPDALCLPYP